MWLERDVSVRCAVGTRYSCNHVHYLLNLAISCSVLASAFEGLGGYAVKSVDFTADITCMFSSLELSVARIHVLTIDVLLIILVYLCIQMD